MKEQERTFTIFLHDIIDNIDRIERFRILKMMRRPVSPLSNVLKLSGKRQNISLIQSVSSTLTFPRDG
jgi:hypothetical protein